MGEFPSGQRGQTVNLLRIASMVRIRPPPPQNSQHLMVLAVLFCVEVRIRTHLNAARTSILRAAPLFSFACAKENADRIHPPLYSIFTSAKHCLRPNSNRDIMKNKVTYPYMLIIWLRVSTNRRKRLPTIFPVDISFSEETL